MRGRGVEVSKTLFYFQITFVTQNSIQNDQFPANIWVPLRCHPLFGDVNQRKGGKRKNLSQTCKHKLAETVFNSISYSEKAFAYKLKNDVLKRKSEGSDQRRT